jgi:hypothetical protein
MIKIGVSNIAALCGKHDYKSRQDALQELFRKESDTKFKPNYNLLKVKTDLYNSSFHQWYCRSKLVTSKMRIIARSVIVNCCKKHDLKFNRPFSYFCKERGLYREKMNTDKAAAILSTKVFNRQKRLEKCYEHFRVCGAIDGETKTHIIEIKSRSSPILEPPIWERVQVSWYAYILQKPAYLFSFHNGLYQRKEITLESATELAEKTLPDLKRIFQ